MKSVKYLEMLQSKQQLGITEMAKLLKITQPAMSNIFAGRRIMENETCIALALALQIEPIKIIMAADMDRAERSGQKSLWEVFTARMAATASALLLAFVVNLFLTPTPAEAATSRAALEEQSQEYKLCEIMVPREIPRNTPKMLFSNNPHSRL
ncbi:helix-turn-helix domain-containing protein [Undibacterium sp. TJN25]|uniref:helix-turn-helix domain-containing protein n=1 Tax=Undibacterium sp. TJN25 TaxID=3413056 RepID=UPI003BF2F547